MRNLVNICLRERNRQLIENQEAFAGPVAVPIDPCGGHAEDAHQSTALV